MAQETKKGGIFNLFAPRKKACCCDVKIEEVEDEEADSGPATVSEKEETIKK